VVINRKVALFGIILIAGISGSANAASCTRNASGEITDTSSACTVTPDAAYFPVYKFGLCEEVPTYQNYQTACTFLVDSSKAQEIKVTKTSSVKLDTILTPDKGTYKATVLLIGKSIGIIYSGVFEIARNGLDGGDNTSNGKFCSTRLDSGSEDDLESNLDCDTSVLDAGKFTEPDAYGTQSQKCFISSGTIQSQLSFNTSSGSTKVCGMRDASTLETYTSGDTNATRQLVVQTFSTPVTVTANTKTMDIAFKVTDMLSIEKNVSEGTTYTQAYIDGFEVTITVQ